MMTDLDEELDRAADLLEAGKLPQAAATLDLLLQTHPENPDAMNLLALIQQSSGHLQEAVVTLRRLLILEPDFPEALANLARALRALSQPSAAREAAAKAVELAPDLPEAHLQLGSALLDLGETGPAIAALTEARRLRAHPPSVAIALGNALLRTHAYEEALSNFSTALSLDPSSIEARVNAGATLTQMARAAEAVPLLREAAALAPNDPSVLGALSAALHQTMNLDEAVAVCDKALALVPRHIDLLVHQGANQAALGRFDEAERLYRQALAIDPQSPRAQAQLALLHRADPDSDQIQHLDATLNDQNAGLSERIAAGFALGTLMDKAGSYDRAFAAYWDANELLQDVARRQGREPASGELARIAEWAAATFTPDLFNELNGIGSQQEGLVFIVGMPRSGTTLVEQIAASHPAVFGAGERKDVAALVEQLDEGRVLKSPRIWNPGAAKRLADGHAAKMRTMGGSAVIVIDKLPDNMQLLGQIAVLFPRSRIIHCRRDMRDVALSCFFQNFVDGASWTHDLLHCVDRCVDAERLMDVWKAVLPLPVLEVHYESLVDDLEAQARRLITFLGLDWEPACLDFHRTERAVITASQWQVRQPLYATSVGRWRHYAKQFGPLLKRFDGTGKGAAKLPPSELIKLGRLQEAEEACRANVAVDRRDSRSWHILGSLLVAQARLPDAIHALQQALKYDPGLVAAHADLAQALRATGDLEAAQAAISAALSLDRNNRFAMFVAGCIHQDRGQLSVAAACFKQCCTNGAASGEEWHRLSGVLTELGDYAGAIAALQEVIRLHPERHQLLIDMGWLQTKEGRPEEAAAWFRRATAAAADDPMVNAQLASALLDSRDADGAIAAACKAVKVDPAACESWVTLGRALSLQGRFDEAQAALKKSLELDPDQPQARFLLSTISPHPDAEEDATTLHAALQDEARPLAARVSAGFALFRTLDRRADNANAFAALEAGNLLARRLCESEGKAFDGPGFEDNVQWIMRTFTQEAIQQGKRFGNLSEAPVFVVGMPRSGTTLVEQIAASHPAVHGAGELRKIVAAVEALDPGLERVGPLAWNQAEKRLQADRYLHEVLREAGDAARVIDKAPGNVMFLGFIAALFPNARVVLCRRDPRDTCFSCYSQLFSTDMAWSFDQKDCALQAVYTERVVQHWAQVQPLRMLEMQYETLVNDLEGQSKRLIDFLGLDWDPACLDFHQNNRTVFTASHWQVKQPIYHTSIGRWRNYEPWLGPMLDGLKTILTS